MARLDEPGRLVRRVDDQHPALEHGVVRDYAAHLAVQPGETGDDFPGPQRVDLEEGILIDQPSDEAAHIERLALTSGNQGPQVNRLRHPGLRHWWRLLPVLRQVRPGGRARVTRVLA